jgi:hypothetical protein
VVKAPRSSPERMLFCAPDPRTGQDRPYTRSSEHSDADDLDPNRAPSTDATTGQTAPPTASNFSAPTWANRRRYLAASRQPHMRPHIVPFSHPSETAGSPSCDRSRGDEAVRNPGHRRRTGAFLCTTGGATTSTCDGEPAAPRHTSQGTLSEGSRKRHDHVRSSSFAPNSSTTGQVRPSAQELS